LLLKDANNQFSVEQTGHEIDMTKEIEILTYALECMAQTELCALIVWL
jgi:hypothetical protein